MTLQHTLTPLGSLGGDSISECHLHKETNNETAGRGHYFLSV